MEQFLSAKFLSGRNANQKIGILDSTENVKVLEVVGRAGIGTTIFDAEYQLDVRGDAFIRDTLTVDKLTVTGAGSSFVDLNVTGVSTFGGNIDANAGLDVDGLTDLDELNVAGIATFASDLDVNASVDISTDLTVDGLSDLDELNVAGIATFASDLDVNASVDISTDLTVDGLSDLDELNVAGIATFASNIDVDGLTNLDELNVSGLSTFASNIDANAGLDVDGLTNLDELNVSGLSTFASVSVSGLSDLIDLRVTGIATFLPGSEFIVNSGIATFSNSIDVNGSLDVDGLSDLDELNVAGIATFASDLDVNASVDISTDLTVDGLTDLDELNVAGIATFASDLDVNASVDISTSLTVGSATTITGAGIVAGIVTGTLDNDLTLATSGTGLSGSATYNNSGAATFTVASNATDANTGGTIVARDGSGNFSAGTITADLVGDVTGDLTGVASTATKLQNARDFSITGDFVTAPAISFDGTGNVAFAATVTADSITLGTYTSGDYVQSITGTTSEIEVTGGTGEGSTPQIGLPDDVTITQDLQVNRDVQINRNLNVDGNITIGGTTATLFTQTLTVADADLILGVRTDGLGNDVATDSTANHGGIAIASTEGNPLVDLYVAGIETVPTTYKKIMWFKAGTFSGLGTDAWLSNYAVGIGSTQFPTGTRLAAGNVQVTENDISVVRNINASGIITGTLDNTLTLATSGNGISGSATYDNSGAVTFTVTSDATDANTAETIVHRDASGNFSAGTITASLSGNVTGDLTGTATTATNLAGGDTGDIPYQSAANTTTFVDASSAVTGQILLWNGSAPEWNNVSAASGAFGGVTIKDEGSTVGTAGSVGTLNFVGNNIQATASTGANGVSTITMSDTPTFDELTVTGISTLGNVSGVVTFANNVHVGSGITMYASTGIVSATSFFGSGGNLEDLILGKIEGLQVQDEGSDVGIGYTFSILNFVGPGVTATAGIGSTATITIPGFAQDADGNLFAGTNAGGGYDPVTGTSLYNIFLGENAGAAIANGDYNTFLGYEAGCSVTTGIHNIIFGCGSGSSLQTGSCNVFLGHCVAPAATGCYNFVSGHEAGKCMTSGSGNILLTQGASADFGAAWTGSNTVAIGKQAGRRLCGSSNNNVFLGKYSGYCVTTGSSNVFIGDEAGNGSNAKTGSNNVVLGKSAGTNLSSANHNFFGGYKAGCATTTGACNIFLGQQAGLLSDGTGNVFLGSYAGKCATSGDQNFFVGYQAGCGGTGGTQNFFVGYQAGCASTGNQNILLGRNAGAVTTGCCNFFVGLYAGRCGTTTNNAIFLGSYAGKCTSGDHNVFLGTQAGCAVTSGQRNIFIGQCSGGGSNLKTGSDNVFLGPLSGASLTSGACNVVIGYNAGNSCTSSNNVFLGRGVAQCATLTGGNNIFLGQNAGCALDGTSQMNVAIGNGSGRNLNGGQCNVFLGKYAGSGVTSGSHNIGLGYASAGDATGAYNITIGNSVQVTGSKNLAIGCSSSRWIVGDSSFNVTFGGVPGTTGIVTAYANGNFCASSFYGDGSNITNVPFTSLTGIVTHIVGDTSPQLGGNLDLNSNDITGTGNVNITGIVTATSFIGDGSGLTGVSAGTTPTENTTNQAQFIPFFVSTASTDVAGISTQSFVFNPSTTRMGIGTDSPQATLHVVDELLVSTAGAASTQRITQRAYTTDNGTLSWEGSAGQLFSVTNNLTSGSIFSVNDVSGIPSIDVDADGTIQLAPYGSTEFVGIGTTAPTAKLHVVGGVNVTGVSTFGGNIDLNAALNVSGVSTFGGNIDLNAALDVSGDITGTGDLTLTDTDAGSAAGPELKLYRNSASPADADYIGQIKFAGESDTGVERNYAKITGKIGDATNGTEDGIIEFAHIKDGSQNISGRWNSTTLQLINGTALSVDGDITATSDINANGNIVGDNSTNISGINQVTATTFVGSLTGTATTATNITLADESSDTTCFPIFATDATGDQAPKTDSSALTYNASTGTLSATAFSGDGSALTGISAGTTPTENTTNQSQYIPFYVGTSSTDVAGISTQSFVFNPSTKRMGIGTDAPAYNLHVVGDFAATSKSFVIDHPTKSGKKLRYASLEGPEQGVYVRGRSQEAVIDLPDYWTGLVDEESITVNLTPIGHSAAPRVESIVNNAVNVFSKEEGELDYYYTVYAERKDIEKLVVEY